MQAAFKIIALLLLPAVTIYSCTQNNNKKQAYSLRDAALKEYITNMDSLARQDSTIFILDTTEEKYKILKAVYYNDSPFLAELKRSMESMRTYRYPQNPLYKLHFPYLKNSIAEEAYQFDYSERFCKYNYVITIAKKGDSIGLHAVVFSLVRETADSIGVTVTKEFDKKLTQVNWDNIYHAIQYADFWGLSPYKNEVILDGSPLRVQGITRSSSDMHITKEHSINRVSAQGTALFTAFETALQLAGLKNDCQ